MNRVPKSVCTKEFRDEAVKLVTTAGVGVSGAPCRLATPMKMLANWSGYAATLMSYLGPSLPNHRLGGSAASRDRTMRGA